jgi:hypothetical protein
MPTEHVSLSSIAAVGDHEVIIALNVHVVESLHAILTDLAAPSISVSKA